MSCAVSFVKTQSATNRVHGRGIIVNGGRTQTHGSKTVTEALTADKTQTSVTTYSATSALTRPSQILKEDAGIQVTWVYNLKGEWQDHSYPDPDA